MPKRVFFSGNVNSLVAKVWSLPNIDLYLVIIVFCYVSYNHAWLSDDAFISFRVVDNFANGFGLRWNIIERVQVFTNPLLVLILLFPYLFWKNIVVLSLFSSFLFGIGTLFYLKKISTSKAAFLLSAGFLFSSKAFCDYVYSGLENSLNYLIQVIFFYVLWEKRSKIGTSKLPVLIFLISIGIVSRIDFALIFLFPFFGRFRYEFKNALVTKRTIYLSLAAVTPLLLWFGFAGIYYGSLFPNTYYAKMNVFETLPERIMQGVAYYRCQMEWDPIAFFFLPIAICFGFIFKKDNSHLYRSVFYAFPYLVYVLWIGGDFMAGRFFTYVILLFAFAIAKDFESERKGFWLIASILIIYNISFTAVPLKPMPKNYDFYSLSGRNGITNEKAIYYLRTGLALRGKFHSAFFRLMDRPRSELFTVNSRIFVNGQIGFAGFSLGPDFHIIDCFALSDPLLSRLKGVGRVGHKGRKLPLGYFESIESGKNEISESGMREYYEGIRILTQESVWDRRRWDLFWQYQFGSSRNYPYDQYLVDGSHALLDLKWNEIATE